jgi:hypothetical protein
VVNSAVTAPSGSLATATTSPAATHWVWTREPRRTTSPASSGVPQAAQLLASQHSTPSGSPMMSVPVPWPTTVPLMVIEPVTSRREPGGNDSSCGPSTHA